MCSICAIRQIRIATLEKEIKELRKCADVNYMLLIEAENARLRRVAEAAQIFDESPNAFTHEILHDAVEANKCT